MGIGGEKSQFPVDIKFDGKLRKNGDPLLGQSSDYKDLINMRYIDNGIRGVQGMTKINTTAPTTYTVFKNGIHLQKDSSTETHILMQAFNSAGTGSVVLDNTTAPPAQGDFSATAVYTEAASNPTGFFSQAPDGHIAYCNTNQSLVWGGNEFRNGYVIAMDGNVPAGAVTKKEICL